MAFALMDIEQKLGTIIEMQQEILQFIHATEEAKIEGGIKSLNNAVAEYKFRWDDEEFIRINLNLACDLRKQAEQSKALYLKQINCILDLSDMPHMMQSAAKKVKELAVNLHNYYSALYLGEYAAFLDTLLGNNLKEEYLAYIKGRMEEEQHEYLDLQDRCREWAKKRLESSADYVAAPVYRGLDSFYEKALEKLQIPFDFDKIYKNDKELFQPAEEQMDKLDIAKEGKVTVFPETLQEIRAMYVSLPDIYADDKTVYLRLSGADEDKQLLQA